MSRKVHVVGGLTVKVARISSREYQRCKGLHREINPVEFLRVGTFP